MAVVATDADLPDVNVWLALAVREHPHHQAARAYWANAAAPQLWFCRVTMLGLVRLLSQPRVMGSGAMTLDAACRIYGQFAALPEAGLRAEPADCDARLASLLRADLPARHCTDAYLAAFALSGGLRLVTFDRDFERFPGLALLRLIA